MDIKVLPHSLRVTKFNCFIYLFIFFFFFYFFFFLLCVCVRYASLNVVRLWNKVIEGINVSKWDTLMPSTFLYHCLTTCKEAETSSMSVYSKTILNSGLTCKVRRGTLIGYIQ